MEKECIICGKSHTRRSDFCSEKCHQKWYYEQNKDKILKDHKEWHENNKEKHNSYSKEWRKQHKEYVDNYNKEYYKMIKENMNHIPFID